MLKNQTNYFILNFSKCKMKTRILFLILFIVGLILNLNCTKNEYIINDSKTIPSSPRDLNVIIDTNLITGQIKVKLTWNPPTNNGGASIIQYTIYKGNSPNLLLVYSVASADSLIFYDSNIINDSAYYYSISAKNDVGESTNSNVASIIPMSYIYYPSQPENFSCSPGDNSISLQWGPPLINGGSTLINYKIYKGNSENNMQLFKTLNTLEHTYIDTSVINFNLYFYKISASNILYEGMQSPTISSSPNSIGSAFRGVVTFVDTNFILSGGKYLISAYPSTAWPPTGGGPTAYDTIRITRTNNILNLSYNYLLQNINPGNYVVSVGFRRNSGGLSQIMSIYGCDTLRAIYPGGLICLFNPSRLAIVNPNGLGSTGIDMLSWSDTTKKIY